MNRKFKNKMMCKYNKRIYSHKKIYWFKKNRPFEYGVAYLLSNALAGLLMAELVDIK